MRAKEIINQLNTIDEHTKLEAKKGSAIDKSIMETINSFSNEPNLKGGLIVLGIEKENNSLFPSYVVTGVSDTDKLQSDIATQCASLFNIPIRPEVEVEKVGDKNIIKIKVEELSPEKKPLYFKNKGIPNGIYRRIGSTDQRCTEDDLPIFYANPLENYDASIIENSSIEDINEDSIDLYRKYIKKVKENAEELEFDNLELLYALNAIDKPNENCKLTLTGLLVFGKKISLRRILPMCRVDYIRVSGKEWVEDPEKRFESTLDMRGSLIELLPRAIATIADDLPKGFYLPEGELQSKTESGLPYKVLREAIVNAFIHRSYKVNSPIQIIRYSNRIEITNAGFSLKSIETIGEPGSLSRNPHIASIFHDTNLAETKGTGIKSMRKLLSKSQMLPPTFESSHSSNTFTLRLLLHHLINEHDHIWLSSFDEFQLNDEQKTALIFLREVGALDNQSYRQLTGVSSFQSTTDLRKMVNTAIIEQKGNSKKHTYYIPGKVFLASLEKDQKDYLSGELNPLSGNLDPLSGELNPLSGNLDPLSGNLPAELKERISTIGKRANPETMEQIIIDLCAINEYKLSELAKILNRRENYISDNYINKLMKEGKIGFSIPEVLNHPNQAYKTLKKK
ncbi:putative DNA binding domain-containing protein [Weeksellaceae bacterium TAE3-ERU29]|nr:putative DNA binding domain-containing protein [Weeksellaceae bacterium TAE3-ERU29]